MRSGGADSFWVQQLRLYLIAAVLWTSKRTVAQPPAIWVHQSPGCFAGDATTLGGGPIPGVPTVEECLQRCVDEPLCVAVEYWADHGGEGAGGVVRGDCTLRSAGPPEDPTQPLAESWGACDRQENLDLWVLCERPGNTDFLNGVLHHACSALPGMRYGADPVGTDGEPCGPAELLAAVVGGAELAMCADQDGVCTCSGAVRYGVGDTSTDWFDARLVEFCRNGQSPPSCGGDHFALAVANAIQVAFCAQYTVETCIHRYCLVVADTCIPAVDSLDGGPPEWGELSTTPCTDEIFGDPAPGQPKACECFPVAPDLSGYTGSSGAVQMDPAMTSPIGCQQRCLTTHGCEYFSYEYRPEHELHICYLKSPYADARCSANPYSIPDAAVSEFDAGDCPAATLPELYCAAGESFQIDGADDTDWTMCATLGGRAQCPSNFPVMCAERDPVINDHPCKQAATECDLYGGVRQCRLDVNTAGPIPVDADPRDQCLADCADAGKGVYADPLRVGAQTPACATGCALYFDYAMVDAASSSVAKQTCIDWCQQADAPELGYGQGGCSWAIPGTVATVAMCEACAEPGWPDGCPQTGDCEAGCSIADGIVNVVVRSCADLDGWSDESGSSCAVYVEQGRCLGGYITDMQTREEMSTSGTPPAYEACCACGRGQLDYVAVSAAAAYHRQTTAAAVWESGPALSCGCPEPCAVGQYAYVVAVGQASICIECPPGKYQEQSGQGSCRDCEPGRFQSAHSATVCEVCTQGQYAPAGSIRCFDCGPGRYSRTAEADACLACAAGRYSSPDQADTACLECQPGQYSRAGSPRCSVCPAGKFGSIPGAPSCRLCPAGQFSTDVDRTHCLECAAGRFAPNGGNRAAADCLPCTAGSFAETPGSARCSTCPQGTYAAEASTACGWFADPLYVPSFEELRARDTLGICDTAIDTCFGEHGPLCGDRVIDLLNMGRNANVRPNLWDEPVQVQAVLFCLEVTTFGFEVCKLDPSFGWGIGRLSRIVLSVYCRQEVQAAFAACPPREHDTCCTCFSDSMPTLADDGSCCGDCVGVCSSSISQLAVHDECHAVPAEPCSPLRLVATLEAMLQTEASANQSLGLRTMDRSTFCACRAYADKEAMRRDERTCEDANGADASVCDSSGESSLIRFVTPGLVISDPRPTNPLSDPPPANPLGSYGNPARSCDDFRQAGYTYSGEIWVHSCQYDYPPPEFYTMAQGTCCCPEGHLIETLEQCAAAHDELRLRRDSMWGGDGAAANGIPGRCAWRDFEADNMHWTGGDMSNEGPRDDMVAVCFGVNFDESTAQCENTVTQVYCEGGRNFYSSQDSHGGAEACEGGVMLEDSAGTIEYFPLGGTLDNLDCTWLIHCPGGVAQLRFERLATKMNFDFVHLYDGSTDVSTELGMWSGDLSSLASTEFASTGSALLVRFTSDGEVASEGFEASYACAGSSGGSTLPSTAPDFNRAVLHGSAVAGTCGLVLNGLGGAAEVDTFDYASDGRWTVAMWFNKVSCTTEPWEYLYSHNNVVESCNPPPPPGSAGADCIGCFWQGQCRTLAENPDANPASCSANGGVWQSTSLLCDDVPNINFLMACDDQVDGTFIRSVALSDSDGLVTFDWRMHVANEFQAIEGEWFFYAVAVSPLAVEVSVNGEMMGNEHFIAGLLDDRQLVNTIEGNLVLSAFRSQYTGATLGGPISIGARAHDPAGTGFKGRIAGVHISSETACQSVHRFWYQQEVELSNLVSRCAGGRDATNAAPLPLETCTGWRTVLRQSAGNYRTPGGWLRYNPNIYNGDFSELNQLEGCRQDDGKFHLKLVWPELGLPDSTSVADSIDVNGRACPMGAVVVVNLDCVPGEPDFDPEGVVCANDGTDQEAYCSYAHSPSSCVYCADYDYVEPVGTHSYIQEWKQSSNPVDIATVEGYEEIDVPFNRSGWGGLKRSAASTDSLLDGTVGEPSACSQVDLSGADASADQAACEAAGACRYTHDNVGTPVDEESCTAGGWFAVGTSRGLPDPFAPAFGYVGCVFESVVHEGWIRDTFGTTSGTAYVRYSAAGASECLARCASNNFTYGAMECPESDAVHCMCSNDPGYVAPPDVEDCGVVFNQCQHAGSAFGYMFGGSSRAAVYDLRSRLDRDGLPGPDGHFVQQVELHVMCSADCSHGDWHNSTTATPVCPPAPQNTPENPALSCRSMYESVPTGCRLADGVYWVRGPGGPFQVFCDMSAGWSLVAITNGNSTSVEQFTPYRPVPPDGPAEPLPTFYAMAQGTCCCPEGHRIETLEQCAAAHDELGLRRDSMWGGDAYVPNGIPGRCAWRDFEADNMHWTGGDMSNEGPRADMVAVCFGVTNVDETPHDDTSPPSLEEVRALCPTEAEACVADAACADQLAVALAGGELDEAGIHPLLLQVTGCVDAHSPATPEFYPPIDYPADSSDPGVGEYVKPLYPMFPTWVGYTLDLLSAADCWQESRCDAQSTCRDTFSLSGATTTSEGFQSGDPGQTSSIESDVITTGGPATRMSFSYQYAVGHGEHGADVPGVPDGVAGPHFTVGLIDTSTGVETTVYTSPELDTYDIDSCIGTDSISCYSPTRFVVVSLDSVPMVSAPCAISQDEIGSIVEQCRLGIGTFNAESVSVRFNFTNSNRTIYLSDTLDILLGNSGNCNALPSMHHGRATGTLNLVQMPHTSPACIPDLSPCPDSNFTILFPDVRRGTTVSELAITSESFVRSACIQEWESGDLSSASSSDASTSVEGQALRACMHQHDLTRAPLSELSIACPEEVTACIALSHGGQITGGSLWYTTSRLGYRSLGARDWMPITDLVVGPGSLIVENKFQVKPCRGSNCSLTLKFRPKRIFGLMVKDLTTDGYFSQLSVASVQLWTHVPPPPPGSPGFFTGLRYECGDPSRLLGSKGFGVAGYVEVAGQWSWSPQSHLVAHQQSTLVDTNLAVGPSVPGSPTGVALETIAFGENANVTCTGAVRLNTVSRSTEWVSAGSLGGSAQGPVCSPEQFVQPCSAECMMNVLPGDSSNGGVPLVDGVCVAGLSASDEEGMQRSCGWGAQYSAVDCTGCASDSYPLYTNSSAPGPPEPVITRVDTMSVKCPVELGACMADAGGCRTELSEATSQAEPVGLLADLASCMAQPVQCECLRSSVILDSGGIQQGVENNAVLGLDLRLGEEPLCSVVGPGYWCGEYGCDVDDCCLANPDGSRKACCAPIHCDDGGQDVRGQTITCDGLRCQVPPNYQYASIGFDTALGTNIARTATGGTITTVRGTAQECKAQCSVIDVCRSFLRGVAVAPDASSICWLLDRIHSSSTYLRADQSTFPPPDSFTYEVHQKFDVRRTPIWSNAVDGPSSATFGFSGFGHISGYQEGTGAFACEPDAYPTPGADHRAQDGVTCAAGGPCEVGDVRLSDVSEDSGRVIGVPEIMVDETTWVPICGHYTWNNARGAQLICQRMGYRHGALHTGSAEAFAYGTGAYWLGLCLDTDESLMSCAGGCNMYSSSGICSECVPAGSCSCDAGQPVGFRVVCEDVQPMFLRVWLK